MLAVKYFFVWAVLPWTFCIAAIIRPCLISMLYLMMAFLAPNLAISKFGPTPWKTNVFVLCAKLLSGVLLFFQMIYHVVAFCMPNLVKQNCEGTSSLLGTIGFHVAPSTRDYHLIQPLLPELLTFAISIVTFFILSTKNTTTTTDHVESFEMTDMNGSQRRSSISNKNSCRLGKNVSEIVIVFYVFCVSILYPSLANTIYFIIFMEIMLLWSLNFDRKNVNLVKTFLLKYIVLHCLGIYLYQIEWIRVSFLKLLSQNQMDVIGFRKIYDISCQDGFKFKFEDFSIIHTNFYLTLLLYFVLSYQYRWTKHSTLADKIRAPSLSTLTDQSETCEEDTSKTSDDEMKKEMSRILYNHGFTNSIKSTPFLTIVIFTFNYYYILPLLAMLVYSLLFHSIIGLLYLFTFCILWGVSKTKYYSLKISIFLVLFTEIIFILHYLYHLNLPTLFNSKISIDASNYFSIFGISYARPSFDLFTEFAIKVIISIPIFGLLKQHKWSNKFYSQLSEHDYSRLKSTSPNTALSDSDSLNRFSPFSQSSYANSSFLTKTITKIWIFLVGAVLLKCAINEIPTKFSIGFFVLFCILMLLLNTSIKILRLGLTPFFGISIFYASAVMISIYIYQFRTIPNKVKSLTGLDDNWMKMIGLVNYSVTKDTRFYYALIWPITFILVTILEIKLFHRSWIKMTLKRAFDSEKDSVETKIDSKASFLMKTASVLEILYDMLWRILEVHLLKGILLLLVIFSISQISAFNFVMFLLAIFILLCPYLEGFGLFLMSAYLSITGLTKLLVVIVFKNEATLPFLPKLSPSECPLIPMEAKNYYDWVGLKLYSYPSDLYPTIVSIIGLASICIVKHRQTVYRKSLGLDDTSNGLIFDSFDPKNWDLSWLNFGKFAVDFTFYKFGLEITLTWMLICAMLHMDIHGFLNVIWVIVIAFRNRSSVKWLWSPLKLYTASSLIYQYTMILGLPKEMCYQYPWTKFILSLSDSINSASTHRFFNLAGYGLEKFELLLITDFIMLVLIACQAKVFAAEGEENDTIYKEGSYCFIDPLPIWDFINRPRSNIDILKYFVLMYSPWISVTVIFFAGLGGTTVFSIGYVFIAFKMLWLGSKLYCMVNYDRTINCWKLLSYYNMFIIAFKISLQFVSCVFINSTNLPCIIQKLFGMSCIYSNNNEEVFSKCPYNVPSVGIEFDILCFGFMLFQRRILNSNYFQLCMLEYRVEMILCNRGASLKDKLINEQMIFQQRNEKLKLEMIKMKASKIKEEYFRQQRFCGENSFTPTSYYEAIRSGDYYMFAGEPVANDFVETEYEVFPEVDPGCTGSHEGINLILANQSKSLQNIHTTEEAVDAEGVLKTAISIQAANVEGNFLLNKLKTMSLELAVTLNSFTKEYRYIAHALKSEKKLLKTNLRAELYDCARSLKSIRDAWELNKTDQNIELEDLVVVKKDYYIRWNERNTFSRLFSAVRFFLRSNTDILCYMLAFCATASCGSVAIPLGLMVLLWGSLTPLRPSKKFWIAMILYTQALIILKFFLIATQVLELNFENEKIDITSDSLTWLQLSGLIKPRSLWDVLLLISLFFHRYNLRRLGLWKEKKIYIQTAFAAPDESYEFDVESSQLMGNITKKPKARSFIEKSFSNLFNPKYRVIKDLYPWMFFVDVISFFIVVFGYKYFGDGSTGNIINDISENRVPITFVIMVIAMSFMFVIDRALYLQKSKVGKFIYHLMTIFFIHLWLFFLLPTITLISPNLNKACFLLYLTKGIYLLISAWTIRNGYPNLCSGNLFTHNYNLFNKISFKIFCNIPFLFEIRNTIDWTFTDTSMPLFHYFDLENYKAIFYDLKCERLEEQKQGKPRGVAIKAFSKYMMGLPMVIILILLIWIPLLAFAMVNTIGISVPLEKVEMTINVEGYPSLYQMEVQGVDITNLQMNEYNNFLANVPNIKHSMKPQKFLSRVKRAVSFIKSFSPHDIYRISFRPESENYWLISNHSKNALYSKLLLKERVKIEVDFKVIRERSSSKNEPQQHTTVFSYELKENTTARTALANALKNTDSDSSDVILQSIMPFFITIPIAGEVSPTNQILQLFANDYDISKAFMNLSLAKHNDKNHFSTWSIKTFSNLYNLTDSSYTSRTNNGQHIQMIAFVDRIYPSFINSYLSGGLLAMYVGLVLVIHKAIRSFLTHQPLDVMISQIPNPDYLLKICHDIYLVREVKNFELEQDLFSKFLFLLRSPATLIQWTRHKIKMD